MTFIKALALLVSLVIAVSCSPKINYRETSKKYWFEKGLKELNNRLRLNENNNVAKNIIIYLGDGMGVPTVTSGRIFAGQTKGLSGEEYLTNMEKLDYVALSKVYIYSLRKK